MIRCVKAIIQEGYRIASGQANNSPYPAGSIEMQMPFFKEHGIDLDAYYLATLNLSIAPSVFKIVSPEYTVQDIQWADGFPAEDFSFSKCKIIFLERSYLGLIYYPHSETKIGHFHDCSLIEVITQYIPNISYGDKIELQYNDIAINIVRE